MVECRRYIASSEDHHERPQSKGKTRGWHYIGVCPELGPTNKELRRKSTWKSVNFCPNCGSWVDVNHAVLEQMQREHADLVVLTAVAGQLAAAGEEHEVVGAVPLLDDVQPFLDLPTQFLAVKVAAQEDGLDRLAEFRERLVRRVLHVVPREPPQDRLRLGRAQADRGRVLDHPVVLLADQLPVDRLREDRPEVRVGIGLADVRSVELLLVDRLQPRQELETEQPTERK